MKTTNKTMEHQIQHWITSGITPDMVTQAEAFAKDKLIDKKTENGKEKTKGLSSSQIRKFFSEVRRIEANYNKEDIPMLKVQLAYAKGKAKKDSSSQLEHLYKLVSSAIEAIDSEEKFHRFVQIIEAIVAYHKFHGGKD